MLDTAWLGRQKILVLEPRRIAARGAADRMAKTLGERVGDTIGLRARMVSKSGPRTRIEVITEGVFTRMILDDPSLDGVGAVLFDEFHERSLDADLGLALALDTQKALRDDLRILVMSATLDGARVASLLDGAPVIKSEGRAFPVETRYLGRDANRRIEDQVTDAIGRAVRAERGSLLVFLPGQGEIKRVEERLAATIADPDIIIAPLYGAMDISAQDRAVEPAPSRTSARSCLRLPSPKHHSPSKVSALSSTAVCNACRALSQTPASRALKRCASRALQPINAVAAQAARNQASATASGTNRRP